MENNCDLDEIIEYRSRYPVGCRVDVSDRYGGVSSGEVIGYVFWTVVVMADGWGKVYATDSKENAFTIVKVY
jgi:hypothetical protein